jgi:nucleoside-diphosphate-sugar epimerase
MKTIVTGATGFIGRHLVDALAARGGEVRCLARGQAPVDARANVFFHQVDFDRADLGISDAVLEGANAVYHLAGATRGISAAAFRKANVTVTERLADRLIAAGQSPRLVFVSSQAAAGPAPDAAHPKTESDAAAPIEDYGRSKLAAERAVASRGEKLPFTVVRPVAVYGPGDRDFLAIFEMAKRGVAIYPGIHHSSINAIYVGDLVEGVIAAGRSPVAEGKTYFLGDDTAWPWTSIYSTIADAVGQTRPIEFIVPRAIVGAAGAVGDFVGSLTGKPSLVGKSKALLAKPKYWLCSSARAREDFGFATPTSLREGMRVTYDWYLQHRWL